MIDLLLAAALLQAAPATPAAPAGPDWRSVYRDPRGEVFLDPASLLRSDALVRVTTRTVFVADQPSGMRSAIADMHFNCTRRTVARGHFQAFDRRGTVILETDMEGPRTPLRPVPASSAFEAVFLRVCPPQTTFRQPRTRAIAAPERGA